jgi:hypothetical protein
MGHESDSKKRGRQDLCETLYLRGNFPCGLVVARELIISKCPFKKDSV